MVALGSDTRFEDGHEAAGLTPENEKRPTETRLDSNSVGLPPHEGGTPSMTHIEHGHDHFSDLLRHHREKAALFDEPVQQGLVTADEAATAHAELEAL